MKTENRKKTEKSLFSLFFRLPRSKLFAPDFVIRIQFAFSWRYAMNAVSILFRPVRFLPAVLLCPALFVLAACSVFRADEPEAFVGPEDESASETVSAEPAAAEPAKPTVEITAPLVRPPPPDYANPDSWVRKGGPDPAPARGRRAV